MVGILGDDRAQPIVIQQLVFTLLQVQYDLGSAHRQSSVFYREITCASGLPFNAFLRAAARFARAQRDSVCHDER
ncbi:MAG: hypothetical protein ACI8PT_002525, partial [Gammaproteobacteria bacterium]